MLELQDRKQGVILQVKVQPGARSTRIVGTHDGALKVAVSEPPERGKATAAVQHLLADVLDLPKSNVALLTGPTNRLKQFMILGLSQSEILARLSHACPELNQNQRSTHKDQGSNDT